MVTSLIVYLKTKLIKYVTSEACWIGSMPKIEEKSYYILLLNCLKLQPEQKVLILLTIADSIIEGHGFDSQGMHILMKSFFG